MALSAEEINLLQKKIELSSGRTVGYNEAMCKKSFITGMQVSFSKTIDAIKPDFDFLQTELNRSDKELKELKSDIETLTAILNKYSK